jgi:hypothetical protein
MTAEIVGVGGVIRNLAEFLPAQPGIKALARLTATRIQCQQRASNPPRLVFRPPQQGRADA